MSQSLEEIIKEHCISKEDGKLKLSCKSAYDISEKYGYALSVIGKTCDELDIKIYGCQLGCF